MSKNEQRSPENREQTCGIMHYAIDDAIEHAEKHLGCWRMPMEPYRGTTRENQDVVVGWKLSSRKRWRLDFSDKPDFPGAPPKWVHVNEENFDAPPGFQKIVHLVDNQNFERVRLYYHKWTTRFGYPRSR
jgi:hypothetical protein